jgi:phytoene dehydrogenase-like protein
MKVNIIGAGISGLVIGSYLQMNGFETEIFEKQGKPGGLCTSWKNGDYTFDGSLHWLLGSASFSPFYQLWSELIDMESIRFVNHELWADIEVKDHTDITGNKIFHLYTNLDRLEKYCNRIAPEDIHAIRKLILSIRKIQHYEIPPMIKEVPRLLSIKEKIRMIRFLPLLFFMMKWKKVTVSSFAEKLKNPFLKEAFQLLFDGADVPLLVLAFPLAFSDKKAAGYPVGGSFLFAKKIEEKYLSLGGKVRYSTGVERILTENGVATGILTNQGESVFSDITVSAADWHYTVFTALEARFVDKTMLQLGDLQKLRVYYSAFLVSLGVANSFQDAPQFFRFPLEKELVSPDGTIYNRMETHIMNYDPTLAPAGKTVISMKFNTRNADYWINLRNSDFAMYNKLKTEFADKMIALVDKRLGSVIENIEVVDIATPATFERYTGNWKGSTQGWLPGKNFMASSPVGYELPGLKNFYLSSHWSQPGGGLPVSLKSGRDLVQIICKKEKKTFSVH